MINIKTAKIYKLLKRAFFFLYFIFLKNKNSRIHYFSKWVMNNGDEKLLFNYPLNNKSIVVEVGGYKGFFSDNIIRLYNPNVIIFEPVREFFIVLKKKYKKNKKVKIFNYGLFNSNCTKSIFLSKDGSSVISTNKKTEKIRLVDAANFVRKSKFIDLMSINIEGSEYQVLKRLIETNSLKKIKFLQIQFHEHVPNAINLRKKIITEIRKTHDFKYSYPFVWESFEIKRSLLP